MIPPVLFSTVGQANAFLRSMPSTAQARGERYFRQGRVANLRQVSADEVSATVQGSEAYRVTLAFDSKEGWVGECSCPLGYYCKHIYAAMKSLLAEHSSTHVQELSNGTALAATKKTAPPPRPVSSIFADEVKHALNRGLKAEEKAFLKKLESIYLNCRGFGHINYWHFDQLGFPLKTFSWEELRIWPSFPATLREFWLYVANALQERDMPLPDFMLPVTELAGIQDQLRIWRRKKDVERWKQTLGNTMQHQPWTAAAGSIRLCELRARFTDKVVILEWRRPGMESFEAMKLGTARALRDDILHGTAALTAEAEWVWEAFSQQVDFGHQLELTYSDPAPLRKLNKLFRLPGFEQLLVNLEGKPFAKPETVLCWRVAPPKDVSGDYRLRLERADGLLLPPLLCVLEGRPALFVTGETVFTGPAVKEGVLKPSRENFIPAAALETHSGATFLHSLGVEMPPRLRDRIRTVPLHMAITCALKESYPGSNSEICTLQIEAQSPEGQAVESWDGFSWSPLEKRRNQPRREKEQGVITLYERSTLYDPQLLVATLGVRRESYTGEWTLRVTKKFPEQFAAWIKSLPPEIKLELKGDLASLTRDAIAGHVRLDAQETELDWFDLQVVIDVADTTLSSAELKLLLDARGGYVRLDGKGWQKLHFNLAPEEDEQLARLGLNPCELTSEPQRLHALQLADESAKSFLAAEQFANIQRRAGEIKARVTPAIPETIQATLRPYQADGYHFLAYLAENRFGGILADDMGLGKTLQALAWLEWLRGRVEKTPDEAQSPPSLVVCPKSVTDNWSAEARRFAPGLRVKIWAVGEVARLPDALNEANLHVLNYSQLRLVGESLAPVRWLAVILDEGQYIKNPNSQTAQVARALNAQHRLILSGTPIENRLLDLWSLMAFAMPGVLGSRAQFARLYDAKEDPFARRRLSARVRPFLLRRTKSQVAKDLPDRTEEDLFCTMEGEQRTLYRAELKRAQQMLLSIKTQKELAKERFHFLTSLLRLRQISCHPRLVKPDSRAASAKVEALLEQLEALMEEGHKVLVFSQFVGMLDILREELQPGGRPLFYLAGDTENRGELVRQFQSTEGAAIFLISLKAGGFGLNLTAASYVILFDPWWNPAVENQAIDRTHRIGQTRNVIAYRLLIKGSIEEKIRQLQKQKSILAEDVLGEEKFAQSLTLEDLQFLFNDNPQLESA
jgi:hypothetical protein